ncbi:MAG: hypothetical protein IPJ74_08215 [Saprospiraceae bacterium]|nr:hypothetical protein [Saprospiraceae bacterium]
MLLQRKNLLILLVLLVLTHLFYFPTWRGGFVTDFIGWQARFDHATFIDILYNFSVPSLHQFSNLFFFLLYKWFDTSGLGWYLIFTSAHAINGFLLFRFSKILLDRFQSKHADFIAIGAAFIFLLSPYQTEAVVWKVCLNYLLVGMLMLSVLTRTLEWLENNKKRDLYLIYLFYLLSLFTLELSLMLPIISTTLLLFWTFSKNENALLKNRFLHLVLPQFAFICVYFLLNRLSFGSWIGHYGAETHLKFPLFDIFGNYFRYLTKYFLFTRYFEHPVKEAIFLAFSKKNILIPAVIGGFLTLIFYILFFKRLSLRLRVGGWALLTFFILLTPIINLYFYYLLHVENDRYGYVASLFFALFLAIFISFLPKWGRFAALSIWLIISGFYLQKTNQFWSESTHIYNNLLNSFQWHNQDTAYILNIPDNYNGVLMFRDLSGKDRAFEDALQYIRRKPYHGKLYEVAQYNMTTPNDGVNVQRDSTGTIITTFNQWGTWWWWRGLGAGQYEKEHYTFETKGQSYELRFKQKPDNGVFIYQIGDKWEVFIIPQ